MAMTTKYESRPEWDLNINSVGGLKNICFVESPYSENSSANSANGHLTNGVLTNTFAPPKLEVEAPNTNYYYDDRLNVEVMNPEAAILREQFNGTGLYKGPSRRSEKYTANPARKRERYTEIPGLRGSNIHYESFSLKDNKVAYIIIIVLIVLCLGYIIWLYRKEIAWGFTTFWNYIKNMGGYRRW